MFISNRVRNCENLKKNVIPITNFAFKWCTNISELYILKKFKK